MSKEAEIKNANEDIIRRFALIESRLNASCSATALFEALLEGVEEQFKIPFVWLSLINEKKNNKLITEVKESPKLRERINLVERNVWGNLVADSDRSLLVNSNLKPYFKLFPDGKNYFVRSMAIVPLKINGDVVGSWNNADAFSERYQPEMDTDVLRKFAQFISRRLSELS